MTYKPEPLSDLHRELSKIASAFAVQTNALGMLAQRIEALEALSATPPNADILWQWNATSVEPFFVHAKLPHSERVTFTHVGGRPAVQLRTLPGDTNVNGSGNAERCDLRLGNADSDATEGREWWMTHSVYFPDDYVDQPQSNGVWHWGSVFNWHDDADDGGSQGPLQMLSMPRTATSPDRPTGLHFQVYGGGNGAIRLGDFPVAPIERNRWYDFLYHVRWTSGPSGFADGWVTVGQLTRQFMSHRGPTLHTGHGAYLKLANYHTAHGSPSSVCHGRIRRGKTRESVVG